MYRMEIRSTEPIQTIYSCGSKQISVLLEVGNKYEISIAKPKTKKDKANNGRVVEVLGFSDDFFGDVIIKYLDNNRRGRLRVGCLLPYSEYDSR